MFNNSLIICSIALTLFIGSAFGVIDDESKINCSVQRKCSNTENIVWATDYKQCYVFRNRCIYANEMCMRREKYQDEFKLVTKLKCKKFCPDACTEQYAPVCGEYNNDYKTFPNMCYFYRNNCQNGESYIFVQDGKCNFDGSA